MTPLLLPKSIYIQEKEKREKCMNKWFTVLLTLTYIVVILLPLLAL